MHGLHLSQGASGMFLSPVWCNMGNGCQNTLGSLCVWFLIHFWLLHVQRSFTVLQYFGTLTFSYKSSYRSPNLNLWSCFFLFFLSENFPLRCVAIILGAKVPSAEIIVNSSVRVNCKFSVPPEKPCTRPSCFHFCRADNIVSPLCTAHGPHVCSSQLASTCTFPIQFKRILKFNF